MITYEIDRETSFYGSMITKVHLPAKLSMEDVSEILSKSKGITVLIPTDHSVYRQRKEMLSLLDSLTLQGNTIVLRVNAHDYYEYLRPHRIFFSIKPIERQDEYRKKAYRIYVLHRYISEAPHYELTFRADTDKDEERINTLLDWIPAKYLDKLKKHNIVIKTNNFDRTFNYWQYKPFNVKILNGS